MSNYSETELHKLEVMYEGDKSRDASSKIRGFLFQDYIAIMCLLKENVEYICLEYLEDIDVFYDDDTFEFIQVKHYPKSSPDMNEISTDLYYQYLRIKMLSTVLKPKPSLYIHSKDNVIKPETNKIKEYLGLGNTLPKSQTYPEDSENWLQENIYIKTTKIEQKESLFTNWASENTIDEFHEKYTVKNELEITEYKEELLKALLNTFPNSNQFTNEENWKSILMGLAILFIQRRYTLDNANLDEIKIKKNDFNQYMNQAMGGVTEQTIANYLISIICEKYEEIIKYNDFSDLQSNILRHIYLNTINCFETLTKTIDGQYRLINTCSYEDASRISKFKQLSINERFRLMAENKQGFLVFLSYLWKIVLDICQTKIKDETAILANIQLCDPIYYFNKEITDYVCLNFPDDKNTNFTVILPRAGSEFNGLKRKIVERMLKVSKKPEKWFFENNKILKGKNYYNYSTANVNETPSITELGEDTFYIECMECIRIDMNEWNLKEDCKNCIFSERCIKGE